MFGFSLTKLIFTVAIVFVVWKAFSYFTRVQNQRQEKPRVKPRGGESQQPQNPGGVQDMVECPVCKAYVAQGTKSCGKDNCPYPG